MTHQTMTFPDLGFGLGLRAQHYPTIFEQRPSVGWFEIISENFMDTDGRPKRNLERIKELYPIVMHGVALSIGTVDPLNSEYLQKLKALINFVQPAWISDHLCWTGVAHKYTHDLLPIPYTDEALKHIVRRIKDVQDYLERPIAFENPSTYLEFTSSHMPEAEFIARMAEESGCNLLLDVNNIYVTCYNHRQDPKAYIDALPLERVIQIHLSGHSNHGTHIIDTHDSHVVDDVWQLYKYVVHRAGRVPNTMVEWDDNIPDFDVLYNELEKAKTAAQDHKNYTSLPNTARKNTAHQHVPLQQSQTQMQNAILLGDAFNSEPDKWIRSKEQFPPTAQLGVYINAYRYRLNDVTAEDYSVLKEYLGEEHFNELLWDFVCTEQSEHFNIGRYAIKLAEFVKKKMPDDVFAYELCQLETAISQLTDPTESPALSPEALQGLTPDALMRSTLSPRTALQLMKFSNNVNAYYRSTKEDKRPKAPEQQASYLAVLRDENSIWRMDLEQNEHRMLQLLFSGKTLHQALETLSHELQLEEATFAAALSEWFARWMRNRLLSRIELTDEPTERKHHATN